jgi:hypothetical protein
VRPSRYDTFAGAAWWRGRRDAKAVVAEYEKLAHFWLRERWTIEPCGSLRRRATGQASATAFWMSGASSPLACSSRTMSQPPMNLPPT